MELKDAVRKRRMVRDFDPDRPVPREVLDSAVRLGLRAPSAGFSQGWDFVVLTDPADRQAFWDATTDADEEMDRWLAKVSSAPALILCCGDKNTYLRRYAQPDKPWQDMDDAHWPVPYWDVDTGMAAHFLEVQAVDFSGQVAHVAEPAFEAQVAHATAFVPAGPKAGKAMGDLRVQRSHGPSGRGPQIDRHDHGARCRHRIERAGILPT